MILQYCHYEIQGVDIYYQYVKNFHKRICNFLFKKCVFKNHNQHSSLKYSRTFQLANYADGGEYLSARKHTFLTR